MAFAPLIRDVKPMAPRIFGTEPVGLERALVGRALPDRLTLAPERTTLFIDFAGYRATTLGDVEAVREAVARVITPLGDQVDAVINYDGCSIDPGG
jgi:propionate CoA-transferase